MALKICTECGNQISSDAPACPKCGKKMGMSLIKKVLIGFGVLVVLGAIGNASDKGRSESSASPPHTRTTNVSDGEPVAGNSGPARAVSETRATLSFGRPTVKPFGGNMGTKVMVEATNNTSRSVTCVVTATFKQGGTILGTANGALNDVPAGGTRTAELITMDKIGSSYDELKLEAGTCF